ncbi:hypothetical protein SJ05684_b42170 (plasmid) [Sinorhizobium sojae CCBAU 05684]|uniref:Uncharacterized protein n=1 Tax=Sinorhizobium sojae CCBAU 05684 TaxID=716928 RepID=A0A249PIP9_9HYPH|nr:hypothetical protein SJ05684_b42170 [Sinorhizobium sojae CCBAU 05684]
MSRTGALTPVNALQRRASVRPMRTSRKLADGSSDVHDRVRSTGIGNNPAGLSIPASTTVF